MLLSPSDYVLPCLDGVSPPGEVSLQLAGGMLCFLQESPGIGKGSRYLVFTGKVVQYLNSNLTVNSNTRLCYRLYGKC